MLNRKRMSPDGVEAALDKVDRDRLLHEPVHEESICLAVPEIDPANPLVLIALLLTLIERFPAKLYDAFRHAEKLIPQLNVDYDQACCDAIVNERWGVHNGNVALHQKASRYGMERP